MNKFRFLFTIILIAMLSVSSHGQMDPSQPLPNDETVKYGVLENGLTYFIKANQEPRERASFYIIQNVGSLLEEDNQNGLAHFLEHMAFNGTENFPEKGITDFLERHGVAFGADINAYTSFNETVYNLSDVPMDKPGVLDTSLLILHDWSHYLLLTDEEIDAERGVIEEEWRTRRNASFRMFTASLPYLFPDSKYTERNVIGDIDIIRNFKYQTIRDFYHKWYRTDLQAIAVVGDFDANEVEQKVIELFSGIPAVEDRAERPFFEIPDQDEMVYGVVTDKEMDQTYISLMIRHRKDESTQETITDLREDYIRSLFNSMMGMRINELLQKGDPPFVMGSVSYGDLERGYEIMSVDVVPKPGEEELAFSAIMMELEKVKRYGFTAGELERAKSNILTRWEQYYRERDKISNEEYIADYQNKFLDGDAFLSAEQGYLLVQALLPTITLEDFDAHLEKWITDQNRVLLIQGTEEEEMKHLSENAAVQIMEHVAMMDIEPYEEEELAESLVSEDLGLADIIEATDPGLLGAVEWTLQNGAKVVFRKADYEKDQVQLRAYSVGGSSLYADEYVPTTSMLTSLIGFYGVGDFDATGLQKMLAGKNISLQLALGSLNEGLSGNASPRDMETLMQLVYLYFVHPRFDEEAHQAIMARYSALIENLENNPQKIMSDSLSLILTDHNPRTRLLNDEFLEDIDLDKIREVYLDRYEDASDYIFVIVGNMEEEEVSQLARKYIGAIPDMDRTETWIDRKVNEPDGRVEKVIPVVLETPKANVNIILNREMEYTPYNNMMMRVIDGILTLRYDETVREEEGGTYGVGLRTSLSHWPESKATLQIAFDCAPDRYEELKGIVYAEMEKLAKEGPAEKDLSKTVENILKDREESKEHNAYYLNTLYTYVVHGINFDDPSNYEDIVNGLTVEDVQKGMEAFYNDANVVDVVFVPEEAQVP